MTRELVLRAQAGDHQAFERLAAANARRLHGVATLIVRDPDAARDAVQETLIEVWRSLPTLREPDAFEGWLQRILVRACHRAVQSRRRRLVEIPGLEIDAPVDSHERDVDDRDQIERAFRRLTLEQRTVLVLSHHLGLSLAESAAVLGIPLGTMKSRLNRATHALRAAVEADQRPPLIAERGTA
jgi:RNA polymerase sigma-70 factor (ECF subfamily)